MSADPPACPDRASANGLRLQSYDKFLNFQKNHKSQDPILTKKVRFRCDGTGLGSLSGMGDF